MLQDYCPEAQLTQLFLTKDEKGTELYTYLTCESKYNSTFASLIKAQHENPTFEQEIIEEEEIQQTAGFKGRKMQTIEQPRKFLPTS